MKRIFGMILVVALLMFGLQANAEGIKLEEVAVISNPEAETIWEERAYVDEFDMPTDEYYVSNAEVIIGTFSNSATTSSLLGVYFFIDEGFNSVSIRLIEYGRSVVKNSYSSDRTYSVVMMDTYGDRHSLTGTLSSGDDVLNFDTEDSDTIIRALRGEGAVRFAITEDKSPTTKYIFSIENTCSLEIDAPISSISYLGEGLIRIQRGEKYGMIDTKGNIIARCVYYYMIKANKDGLICVAAGRAINSWYTWTLNMTKGGQGEVVYDYFDYGIINKTGKVMVPCEYDDVRSFREGLVQVKKDDKWGYIDATGTLVIPCEYDDASSFSEGLASVEKNGKEGFIDTTGTLVIPCEYDYAYSFSEGLAEVKKDDKWGYIDATGTLVIPCEYDYVSSFSEGLAEVKKNDKWGIIDTTGTLVIPCEYDYASYFSKGVACVKKNDKWGYIDTTGTLVIPCEYDGASYYFSEGLASVEKNGKEGFIDTTGTLVIPCEYDYVSSFREGLVCVKKNGKYGFINTKGTLVIPCEYDEVSRGEGTIITLDDEKITVYSIVE